MSFKEKKEENKINVEKLSPTSYEIMKNQATINIGTIGHVAHGKTTVVRSLTGIITNKHSDEQKRNITIKLGYANAKIYKCNKCPRPQCYQSRSSNSTEDEKCSNKDCDGELELKRHVSFVDCPGHDILMATMLNGAAIMDAALLLIGGNETCPQPQTSEHFAAIETMKLKNIIILQNKVDLVSPKETIERQKEIKEFVKGTIAEKSPIIPISAQLNYNIDVLCEYLVNYIPVPIRDYSSSPRLIIVRSFDVNKPGDVIDLQGGIAGGTVLRGVFRKGQTVEIRPGIIRVNKDGSFSCTPIATSIASLYTEKNELDFAVPGGLIGVGTKIDPTLTRQDRLVGNIMGNVGELPPIFDQLEISYFLLSKLMGVKGVSEDKKVQKLKIGENITLNIGSTCCGARVIGLKKDLAKVQLQSPVCSEVGEKLAISRKVDKHLRLIGWGKIQYGREMKIDH